MIIDGFVHQLPDVDPAETEEWLDSLDAVIDTHGEARARLLLSRLTERARQRRVGVPAMVSTPYVNTIPAGEQVWFPGDEAIERRIRAFVRWNAAVMVVKANHRSAGIGGHLATFASSASLYDVGFNHFWRGKADGQPGDQVYIQGHASPGIYARAFLEGRLTEAQLDSFRREVGGGGLSSYPHPRLMPDFWEYPTVSMGLGPIMSIYQARFNRYLQNREIVDTSAQRVWCMVGDGEVDEPETFAALSLAAREQLDNLTWVVNCNLQRLDGPVRGNGKIIQELEAIWAAADARAKGFLLGATAGRTTLAGEGLQHQDGHSLLLASAVPSIEAYDPAFAYEVATIIRHGLRRMYVDNDDAIYYLTLYNENYPMPPMPDGVEAGIIDGMYRWQPAPDDTERRATILFSGTAHLAASEARNELAEHYSVGTELWSVTSYKRLREDAMEAERWNRLHPTEERREPLITARLAGTSGPIVAVTDFMRSVPDQISRWVPRTFISLGTDGFGRSDARSELRRFFEIDAAHLVVAVLSALQSNGQVEPDAVVDAIARYGIDPATVRPWAAWPRPDSVPQ